jgi:hypothetical protein
LLRRISDSWDIRLGNRFGLIPTFCSNGSATSEVVLKRGGVAGEHRGDP